MSEQQQRKLELLSQCTFIPGSWPKKFVRSMRGYEGELTVKQAYWIDRLYYMYRHQIRSIYGFNDSMPLFEKPTPLPNSLEEKEEQGRILVLHDSDFEPPDAKQQQAIRKLADWNRKAKEKRA